MKKTAISSELWYYWKGSLTGWRKDIHLTADGVIQDPQIDAIHTGFAEQLGRNISRFEDEFQDDFIGFDLSVDKVGKLTAKLADLEKEYEDRTERYQSLLDQDFDSANDELRAKRAYDNIMKITADAMGLSGLRRELVKECNERDQYRIRLVEGFKLIQAQNTIILNRYNARILHYIRGIKTAAPSSLINDHSAALITKDELHSFEASFMKLHHSVFET